MNPLVTIGVVTYNNRAHIKEALNSLTRQNYRNIEILISDDASKDGTDKIGSTYAKKDKRIRLFVQPKNLGIANNYNFVLSKARGEFFLWHAGDDLRHPDFIKQLVSLFQKNSSCVFAASAMHQFSQTDHHYEYLPFSLYTKSTETAKKYLLHPEYGPALSFGMYKTRILRSLGGYHKDIRPIFGGASEFITVYKMLLQGDLGYINRPLFLKRDTGYFLSIYRRLQSGDNFLLFASKIGRYLTFPLFIFSIDLIQSIRYTHAAGISSHQKNILYKECIKRFVQNHIRFFSTLAHGLYSLLSGLNRKGWKAIFLRL